MLPRTLIQGLTSSSIILVAAFVVYAVYLVLFLTDPWSSWAHIETPYYDPVIRATVAERTLAGVLAIVFAEPIRLRPVMQGLELLNSLLRPLMVSIFGFNPSLANAISALYFAVCPVLAFFVARRMLGRSAVESILIVLALGVLLTSVGYVSASIFVFHPSKNVVIAATLVAFLVSLRHMQVPKQRYVVAIGALQFTMAMTDEIGLPPGFLMSGMVAVYVIVFRRDLALHLGWLVAFGVATIAAYAYRFGTDWTALAGGHIYGGEGVLQRLLGGAAGAGTSLEAITGHLAAAFSSLYGLSATRYLFLFGVAVAVVVALLGILPAARRRFFTQQADGGTFGVAESSFLMLAAVLFLIVNVYSAVLLLRFGGSLYLSIYNYYYASVLPVFAFLVVCAAFRMTAFATREPSPLLWGAGWFVRTTLGLALGLALAANVVNMPRVNSLAAMIHNNPYIYGAMNEAGRASLRKAPVGAPLPGEIIKVPRCGESTFTREFNKRLDALGTPESIRRAYLVYPSKPFVDEKYLSAFFVMMLRRNPVIEVVPGSAAQCE